MEFFDEMILSSNLWLCSYGGVKSNELMNLLQKYNPNIKIFCKAYGDKGCHFSFPIPNKNSKNYNHELQDGYKTNYEKQFKIKCAIFYFQKILL